MTDHELALLKFGERALNELKECIVESGFDVDAERLADHAVAYGLMEYVPYDPEKHGESLGEDYEPGDMIYYWGTTPQAAANTSGGQAKATDG